MITPEQDSIMKRLLNAADVLQGIASNAARFNMPILARECEYMANEMRLKVGLQRRALESPLFGTGKKICAQCTDADGSVMISLCLVCQNCLHECTCQVQLTQSS